MRSTCIHFFILALILAACTPLPTPTAAEETLTPAESTNTATHTLTTTSTFTLTATLIPPTATATPVCDCTPTPSPTIEVTEFPTGEMPGAFVRGTVTLPNGEGIAGINIYHAFSAYSGELLDVTNSEGYYEGFIYIPHEETVRVWAESDSYDFKPGLGNRTWMTNEFAWHYYNGYENVNLSFIGTPR